MTTKETRYVEIADAIIIHLRLMQRFGEIRYGVDQLSLIESALTRPHQAATYENADLFRQAATLYFGLIKNHPWIGGNKRTATVLVDEFLFQNGLEIIETVQETIKLVLDIESDKFGVDEIETWLRDRTFPIK